MAVTKGYHLFLECWLCEVLSIHNLMRQVLIIFQVRKWRLRAIEWLAQNHLASRWQSWDPGLFTNRMPPITMLFKAMEAFETVIDILHRYYLWATGLSLRSRLQEKSKTKPCLGMILLKESSWSEQEGELRFCIALFILQEFTENGTLFWGMSRALAPNKIDARKGFKWTLFKLIT